LCRRGAEEKTSDHVLYECEVLATLRHTFVGSFFLDPEDVECPNLEALWNFIKGQSSRDLNISLRGTTRLPKVYLQRDQRKVREPINYSVLFYSVSQSALCTIALKYKSQTVCLGV